MRTSTPLWLLGALGALSLTVADPAAAGDPSTWTCESCPFEKPSRQASVDVGVGAITNPSNKFGDYTGLDDDGGFGILGASLRHRYSDGGYAHVSASDLALDTRTLAADGGREGLWQVRFGYAEIPHVLSDNAFTPFAGTGSGFLSLPAGYPAATTGLMPLAATLQPIELGVKRKRSDVGGTLAGPAGWTWRIDARHDEREGTLRGGASFFSTAAQVPVPVDQVTDQIEVSASYADTRWNASLSYHASSFRNHDDALTWQNPFTSVAGAPLFGRMALPPDNQFHQVRANAGFQVSPKVRASAELAVGRMEQNQAFLPASTGATVALPATSLQGRADTLDASVRLSWAATDTLRVAASATRNERDNDTPRLAYPNVSTDLFVGAGTRTNPAYSFTRDRLRLAADWRGPKTVTLAAGADHDTVERTLQSVEETREATVWARATARPLETLTLSLKGSHAERDRSDYVAVPAVQPAENPLMRKYHLADRTRDAVGLRADATVGESIGLGATLDAAVDDYTHSPLGLTGARSVSVGADLSMKLAENTHLRAFAHGEKLRSTQLGSQLFAAADWVGRNRDRTQVVGIGLAHTALKGKLELGADVTGTHSRSRTIVQTGATAAEFPVQKSTLNAIKLTATWQLRDNVSVLAGYTWERYESSDWRLEGVGPETVGNLLTFGETTPRYDVNLVRVALRYRF